MKIVIDMQAVQSESKYRGIGGYARNFVLGLLTSDCEHEFILVFNGLLNSDSDEIVNSYKGLVSSDHIKLWNAVGPVSAWKEENLQRRKIAEILREAFIQSLSPDLVILTSLFEGYGDDSVVSVGVFDKETPVVSILYDAIPLIYRDQYLPANSAYEKFYEVQFGYAKQLLFGLTISESAKGEIVNYFKISEKKVHNISAAIGYSEAVDRKSSPSTLETFGIVRPFILYTGGADQRKNLPRLIYAFAALPAELRKSLSLVFAGKMPLEEVKKLKEIARESLLTEDDFLLLGHISAEKLDDLYRRCEVFVFPSYHEGFGLPVLEAMSCGAVVIGSDSSSISEIIENQDQLFDPFDIDSITEKLKQSITDQEFRVRSKENAGVWSEKYSWSRTCNEALTLIKQASTVCSNDTYSRENLFISLKGLVPKNNQDYLRLLAQAIDKNEASSAIHYLYLDISELVQHDAATGVQRVVRSYLTQLLQNPPQNFKVMPVYATVETGYRHARKYLESAFCIRSNVEEDDEISWIAGDIFFCLDMQHHVQLAQAQTYKQMREDGVKVKFLIYDLLPIQLEEYFDNPAFKKLHEDWLAMIAQQDGAISISRATQTAYKDWIQLNSIECNPVFQMDWVHIGADLEGSKPSKGLPSEANVLLEKFRDELTFLLVATIEPRKGQSIVLDAFEQLWSSGLKSNLIFVGKKGWKVDDFVARVREHPELNSQLFWLEGITDEFLQSVYEASNCLISASINEGFGLPLIEAAQKGKPLFVRDIPVYREVAGEHAYYFDSLSATGLADSLTRWLELYENNEHPLSDNMPRLTWSESAEKLLDTIISPKKY
ncbi:MAG: glycosyltransferase family 4 protein [Oceanospirillaceae bacterium]|nr:glycosyltransferase family 4 protein [Oceanospirillaceae bacterium]